MGTYIAATDLIFFFSLWNDHYFPIGSCSFITVKLEVYSKELDPFNHQDLFLTLSAWVL